MILAPTVAVPWHTTGRREELVIVLRGGLRLEVGHPHQNDPVRTMSLTAGRVAFLPQATWHRIINRSKEDSHYLYVTSSHPRP